MSASVSAPRARARRRGFTMPRWANIALAVGAFLFAAFVLPFLTEESSTFMNNLVLAAAYAVMALGLNIIVGFAGLLDLGYVAFYALGAFAMGYGGSLFLNVGGDEGVQILADGGAGLHVNFLIILVIAIVFTTLAGMLIGLPTLRLRGDYIAIVTLAFGEIIGRVAAQGDTITFNALGWDQTLTAGRQGITPIDKIDLPFLERFTSLNLRPWYWTALVLFLLVLFVNFRLRDSRLGRAWIALREDEVAAASMGVPLVKTKLLAYGTGAAFGGLSGAFLASYNNTVNADQFQFFFSILILAMVILGGLGSLWGVVIGAIVLSFINNLLIPETFNSLPRQLGFDFDMSQINFGIYGFLLVAMMVLRPQGLVPERRREQELTEGAESDDPVYETRMQ
jgi:branched-chain amino acid transport system permease protein